MARATISFPLPVSPVISTDAVVRATRWTSSNVRRIAALSMMAATPRKQFCVSAGICLNFYIGRFSGKFSARTLKFWPILSICTNMERLWELYRDLGVSLDLDETLSTFDRNLARLIPYDTICISLWRGPVEPPQCLYAAGADFASPIALPVRLEVPPISLYRTALPQFTPEDHTILSALAPKLAACIDNCLRFRRAADANRRALFERLDAEVARIRRSHGRLAVLECAVAGLDPCSAGADQIADALRRALREYDFIARSGDGFLIVLADFEPTALDDVKSRVHGVLHEAGLSCRIGAAHFPVDGYDAEDLLAAAHGAAHA